MLGDEPPKSRDRLRDSGIGHVGQWNRLTVEYAGWVRIVGTWVHLLISHDTWSGAKSVTGASQHRSQSL
jgi:hypothetical protein